MERCSSLRVFALRADVLRGRAGGGLGVLGHGVSVRRQGQHRHHWRQRPGAARALRRRRRSCAPRALRRRVGPQRRPRRGYLTFHPNIIVSH